MIIREQTRSLHLFLITTLISFFLFSSESLNATVIVTNNWAEAVVQVRGNVGGPVDSRETAWGVPDFDIDVMAWSRLDEWGTSDTQNWAWANIDSTLPTHGSSDGLWVEAVVGTGDDCGESEAWLQTSWNFSVQNDPVDLHATIATGESAGLSTMLLYDQTTQSYLFQNGLAGAGGIQRDVTLLPEHDYLFNAYLPRFDEVEERDFAIDGTTYLYLWLPNADVAFSWNGTHVPITVPEPATMLIFGTGLLGLIGSRIRKRT